MAMFSVSTTQLKAKAEELAGLNNNLKTNVSELESCEQNLSGMWEGQAKDAFHQAFHNDKVQMTNFTTLIEKYVYTLLNSIAKYEQAEKQNIETATTRKY